MMGKESISESVMWSVGTGDNINIREDRWLRRGTIGGPANHAEPTKVADLILKDEDAWDTETLNILFDEQTVSEILTIPLWTRTAQDELVRIGSKSGCFSAKSAYNIVAC